MSKIVKISDLVLHCTIFPGDYLPTSRDEMREIISQKQIQHWKKEFRLSDDDRVIIDRDAMWFDRFRVPELDERKKSYCEAKLKTLQLWETTV